VDGGLNVRWTPTLQRSRTVAGCHSNLGRNVTLAACGVSARNAVLASALREKGGHHCCDKQVELISSAEIFPKASK
jgi:hypothetical protein